MNVHANPKLTATETALVDAFAEQRAGLPGDAEVAAKRDEAAARLKRGLPTRKVEAWHYTDLRRLFPALPDGGIGQAPVAASPFIGGSAVFPILNGTAGTAAQLAGAAATPIAVKLDDGSLAPALDPQDTDDLIGAINSAFVRDGWFLDIADGTKLTQSIELQSVQAGGQSHIRLAARIGAGATATIVERHAGDGEALASSVTNLLVGDGAEITWVIVQEQPVDATHLGQFNAWIGKDARLVLCVLNSGGKVVRQEIRVVAKGEGGKFLLRGVNLLAGDTHCDEMMILEHEAPRTNSTEVVRSVVFDRAAGAFQGRINVHADAQKTDAKMSCNTLLLSDEAEFSAKPELEIFADDVQCGHGATVSDIQPEHLFYLRARGIPERQARAMLVRGFVEDTFAEIENEALRDALTARIDDWLDRHG